MKVPTVVVGGLSIIAHYALAQSPAESASVATVIVHTCSGSTVALASTLPPGETLSEPASSTASAEPTPSYSPERFCAEFDGTSYTTDAAANYTVACDQQLQGSVITSETVDNGAARLRRRDHTTVIDSCLVACEASTACVAFDISPSAFCRLFSAVRSRTVGVGYVAAWKTARAPPLVVSGTSTSVDGGASDTSASGGVESGEPSSVSLGAFLPSSVS